MLKWIKRIILTLLITPIVLFGVLVVALYIPSLQNYVKGELIEAASEATGFDIELRRIDLRYPLNLLVSDLVVKEESDSLLSLKSLNLQVKILPLLSGRVDLNELTLRNLYINSKDIIEGIQVVGDLDYFFLKSHGVDLKKEEAVVNVLTIKDTYLNVCINDTATTPPDTTETAPLAWIALLKQCQLKNVKVDFSMPLDSLSMSASIGDFQLSGVDVDLGKEIYALKRLRLDKSTLSFQQGSVVDTEGFNPSNLVLRDMQIALDSIYNRGKEVRGIIRNVSMKEQSGLNITSAKGKLYSDSLSIAIPELLLQTDYSKIKLKASSLWEFIESPTRGNFKVELSSSINREDILLFVPDLPEKFKKDFPEQPMDLELNVGGSLKDVRIDKLELNWPDALLVTGSGKARNVLDSKNRMGEAKLEGEFIDLNFITSLFQSDSIPSIQIPKISLLTQWKIEGTEHQINLNLEEGLSRVDLTGIYNEKTEQYVANISIDSLQIQHFLPFDSLKEFSGQLDIEGQGLDIQSPRSKGQLYVGVDKFIYGKKQVGDVNVSAQWSDALLQAQLSGDNDIVKFNADGQYQLNSAVPIGSLNFSVDKIDLLTLGLIQKELRNPVKIVGQAGLSDESIFAHIESGDLSFDFNTPNSVTTLMAQIDLLTLEVEKQMKDNYRFNPSTLKEVLPEAELKIASKSSNSLSDYLRTQGILFQDLNVHFTLDTIQGVQGYGTVNNIKFKKNNVDTFLLAFNQIEEKIHLKTGFIKRGKTSGFQSLILGEIGKGENELKLFYQENSGAKGLDFGLNVTPLDSGFSFRMIPEVPIIAFKSFQYANNRGFISDELELNSQIELYDKKGVGFQFESYVSDSLGQVMNVGLQQIELGEIAHALPFIPELSGIFSMEGHMFSFEGSQFLSTEMNIDELNYEKKRVGDIAFGLTWLPDESGNHYLDSYLHHDQEEVLVADGSVSLVGKKENLDISTTLHHFPLKMLNALVPDEMVTLRGDIDGNLLITGGVDKPQVNGEFLLDSVAVFSQQLGIFFRFDDRPLKVANNQLKFDKFSIYAKGDNPFVIDGDLSFADLSNPRLNVRLNAQDYYLLDAKRTKESLIYGRVVVDVGASVIGPLDALVMRGAMNLNGKTDVTYVLKDSPLTVQDRLSDLVTFTSFDETHIEQEDTVFRSLGGMSMMFALHIDPMVRLKVDLSADRSSRISLEGGGDLNLQYTQQGDLSLSGRYVLSGGLIRYSLPVIPLKDFHITGNSYVEWTGDPMDPKLNIKASERLRASVMDDSQNSRQVNFDLSVLINNKINDLSLRFDIEAPDDGDVQKLLATMTEEERVRQAVVMMTTGRFMAAGGGSSGNFDMGSALNSVLQSQINSLSDKMENASFSVGVEEHDESSAKGRHTDYSFSYSQRLFNNRVQIVIGGKVSTGANVTNDMQSFIDNLSIEYRLDNSGTRYVRLFHNKNYDNIMEGEILETGVGLILRKKVDRLSELFIFRRKKK